MTRFTTRPDVSPQAVISRRDYPITMALATMACALAPAYVVRWKIIFLPTTLLEIAILATLSAFALETLRHRTTVSWRGPLTIPALLFLASGAISVLAASDHRAALGLYRAYLIEPIAFGLVVTNIVNGSRRALQLLAALGGGGLLVGLANTVVVLAALRAHTYDVAFSPPVVIYNTANDVALFLVPLAAVSVSLALHAADVRVRVVSGAFTALAVLSVMASFSRGGYLALAAVAIGAAISHRLRWWWLAAGIVAAVILTRVPPLATRLAVELDFNNPQNTLVSRSVLWKADLQLLRHHPIFGDGLSASYPHNLLLNFWSETGLLGAAAFAWILVAAFIASWQGWRRSGLDWRPIQLGVFLALVAVVVHGLVDVPYFKNDLSFEFWILVAISWSGVRNLGHDERAARPSVAGQHAGITTLLAE